MRFGNGFHQLLIPGFEPFYIDYQHRKASIKELYIQGQDFHYDLLRIEEFRARVLDSVLVREKEVIGNFHIDELPTAIPVRSFRQVELRFLAEGYRDLLYDLQELRWFDRVNKEAARRLFGKLKRVDVQDTGDHEVERLDWFRAYDKLKEKTTSTSRRMSTLLADLDGAQVDRKSTSHAAPLQETPWRFGPASDRLPKVEALHRMVLQGEADKLVQLAHSDSTSDYGVVQLDQVLKYLILNRLDATAIHILERSPEYVQSLNNNCLLFYMQVAASARESDENIAVPAVPKREEELFGVFQGMIQLCDDPIHQFLGPCESGQELLGYAARHDLIPYCEAILSLGGSAMSRDYMARSVRAPKRNEFLIPFEIMLYRHHSTFIDVIKCLGDDVRGKGEYDVQRTLDQFLIAAVRVQNDGAVRCLVDAGAGISSTSETGPTHGGTSLHIAARNGRVDYIDLLLTNADGLREVLNATEHQRGLTALAIACMYGHKAVVNALLLAGADVSKTDRFGWTAKEHAAYRGHQTIAGLLGDWDRTLLLGGPATNFPAIAEPVATTLEQGTQAVIANLGSVQARLKGDPVEVICCSPMPAAAAKEDTSYSLKISVPQENRAGKATTSMAFDLPLINDDLDTKACVFVLNEDATPVLTFRMTARSRLEPAREKVVGIGSAVMEGIKLTSSCPRESLVRDRTAAILDCDTMEVIGTVLFTFVRATPYPHLQDPLPSQKLQSSDGMMLVGHRGFGQNNGNEKYLQIGENTIHTDLQLTRDLEAVSYHDLSFSESGTDIPIHDLTLEQFRYASQVQSPHGKPASVVGSPQKPTSGSVPRPRSRSVSEKDEPGAVQVQDRVKHTVDFRAKGFKPNTRGEFIHDSLVTLEEILGELPEHVGLNIEFKHPRIHETITAGIAPVVIEINKFIDVALDKIRQSAGNRPLVLSSFTPEVCILLSLKQRAYPVMFISNVGKPPPSDLDKRGASIQTAVHFARRWGLSGVVFASEPFVLCPRLVRYVKNMGLVCGTYGPQNNEPDHVKLQADAGVDLLVTDRVGLIAKALADRWTALP
ncbi:ankyrin repeat-containing protein [Apiospora sp. TS-2023a]